MFLNCPDSILHQLFIVRFLGSMEVRTAESADVISETMRQILAARAIHNIFRMTESHLLVTCDCLKYELFACRHCETKSAPKHVFWGQQANANIMTNLLSRF